jgi:hypothetical protein
MFDSLHRIARILLPSSPPEQGSRMRMSLTGSCPAAACRDTDAPTPSSGHAHNERYGRTTIGLVPGSSRMWWLHPRSGRRPTRSVNRGAKHSSRSSMRLPSSNSSANGTRSDADAGQHTRCSSQTNWMERLWKSHKIGLSDSNHWTPRTMW